MKAKGKGKGAEGKVQRKEGEERKTRKKGWRAKVVYFDE